MRVLKLTLLLVGVLVASAAPLAAQSRLDWEHAAPVADVNATYSHTVTIDGVAVNMSGTVCVLRSPTLTGCSVVIPTLKPGPHTIVIGAIKGGVRSEISVTGFDPANAPTTPGNINLTLTVVVKVAP